MACFSLNLVLQRQGRVLVQAAVCIYMCQGLGGGEGPKMGLGGRRGEGGGWEGT